MSRFKGTFIFGANFEGGSTVPIDARQLVGTYADLTLPATWCFSPVCSTQAIYNGMMTVVAQDPTPENNGIYWLCDAANYTTATSWQKVKGGTGSSDLTGATNGLCLYDSGTTIGLGGTLSEAITTVCATGFTCYWVAKGSDSALADGIYYDNANAAFIGKTFNSGDTYAGAYFSSNGVQLDAGYTGTSSCLQLHWDGNGCINTTNTFTIGSDSSCPIQYAGDYSSAYSCLSIPNAGWVTGQTGAISGASGVNRDGNNIVLGGTALTGDTVISGGTYSFDVFGANSGTTISVNHDIWGGPVESSTWMSSADVSNSIVGQIFTLYDSGVAGFQMDGCSPTQYGSVYYDTGSHYLEMMVSDSGNSAQQRINIGHPTFGMRITDSISSKGMVYMGNYEPNFEARSLVTKQYVDSGITSSSNTIAVCNVNATYTATTENDFIGVSGATCIFLPTSPKPCQRITVADIEGDALSNSIEINGNGTLINGSVSATINTDYGSMTFINNNVSGWTAVAFIN